MTWNGTASPVSLTPITVAFYEQNIAENLDDHQARMTTAESDIDALQALFPIQTASVGDGQITAIKLAAGAATNDRIADNAISQSKMQDASVGTAELIDSSVTNAKMADNSVGTAELIDNSVTFGKMTDNSVGTNELFDSSVTNAKIVGMHGSKITANTITALQVENNTLTNTQMASGMAAANLGYTPARITRGTYIGNGSTSGRQITTGFTCYLVKIHNVSTDSMLTSIDTVNALTTTQALPAQFQAAIHLHATDGFVVGDGTTSGNNNGDTYNWTALGL